MDDAFAKYLKNQLENPAFRRAWEKLGPKYKEKLSKLKSSGSQTSDDTLPQNRK